MLSDLVFDRQFQRFAKRVRQNSGEKFKSFRDGLPSEWEDYKRHVREEAHRRMRAGSWKTSHVGTGRILAAVIAAIEISIGKPPLRNNLVRWENRFGHDKRSHAALLDAVDSAADRRKIESWLFKFFRREGDDAKAFEEFCELAGNRYDLVAYLFFLKDANRFMPIATTTFDKAFKLLGINLVTSHHCGWENYAAYNEALLQIRSALENVAELQHVDLLDAHSFCWMLVRLPREGAEPELLISAPRTVLSISSPPKVGSPATAEKLSFSVFDEDHFADADANRRRLGRLAQDIALRSERERLRKEGHADPETAVIPVWDQPGRGYDILSCEIKGRPRHIEVKAARRSGKTMTFYITRNEWKKSRELPGYYFYLVTDCESRRPVVLAVAANRVVEEFLKPVTFVASFATRS